MAVTLSHDDSFSEFRVIEGMHRATAVKELMTENGQQLCFTMKSSLLMRLSLTQEALIADKMNMTGDDRNKMSFLFILEDQS